VTGFKINYGSIFKKTRVNVLKSTWWRTKSVGMCFAYGLRVSPNVAGWEE